MENLPVLVAGSIAYDHLYSYDGSFLDGLDTSKLQELSISYLVTDHTIREGGTGGNTAWSLGLLGQQTLLHCSVGRDGDPYLNKLKGKGIDTSLIHIEKNADTAHAVITTDNALRQITIFDSGAEIGEKWYENTDHFPDCSWAIVGPWIPEYAFPVYRWAAEKSIPCMFDPGQQIVCYDQEQLRSALDLCKGVILNDYEWSLLQDHSGMSEKEIIEKASFAIVTAGEEGFSIHDQKDIVTFTACKAPNYLNPTGAGDAFRAGLLTGLARGWSLTNSCLVGASLASICVEHEGAHIPELDLSEVQKRVQETYGVDIEL